MVWRSGQTSCKRSSRDSEVCFKTRQSKPPGLLVDSHINKHPAMRFQAIAAVESEGYLTEPLILRRPPYIFELQGNDGGQFSGISISKTIEDYHDHLPQVSEEVGGLPVFSLRSEPQVRDLVAYLQHIESFGSLWCGIQKVHWETAKYRWVPESPEEESLIQISEFSSQSNYPTGTYDVTEVAALLMVTRREEQERLLLPMSFFREGMNEFREKRHLYAFFNFYFFVEDVFGGGKAKNQHILQEYLSSRLLCNAVQSVLAEWSDPRLGHHKEMLDIYLDESGCDASVKGVLKLVVKMRGQLHHFSQRSSQRKGHPLNQREFETLASCLCQSV
jgi:hypothetical protein